MEAKKRVLIGVFAAIVLALGIFLSTNSKLSEEQITMDVNNFISKHKDVDKTEAIYDVTELGSSVLYEENKITYVTKKDDVYSIELDNDSRVKSVKLVEDKNVQFYNAIHPDKHTPTGFKHTLGEWNTGYVIEDNEKNEFVWIPVVSKESYTKKLGPQDWSMTKEGMGSTKLEEEVKGDYLGVTEILGIKVENSVTANIPEAEVVNRAGGFWVGRYEAGSDSKEESFNIDWDNTKLVEKEGVQPVRCIPADSILTIANNWKKGEKTGNTVAYQSGLITGTEWDMVCKFIGWDTANDDCSDWGCYATVESAKYTGYHSSEKSSDWIYEENVVKDGAKDVSDTDPLAAGRGWVFPTGKFVNKDGGNTAKKNIYDLAGNVWEWTTEVPQYETDNEHVIRGGCAGDTGKFCATARFGHPWYAWNVGMRLVLYVE